MPPDQLDWVLVSLQLLKIPAAALAVVAWGVLASAGPCRALDASPQGAWTHIAPDPVPLKPVIEVPTAAARARQAPEPAAEIATPPTPTPTAPTPTAPTASAYASPAEAPAAPAAQLASVPALPPVPAPAPIRPKIIDAPGEDPPSPARHTADRDQLLREFPDEYVEAMWLQDWTDLERAHQFGRLVDVVSDPEGKGIMLRLEGGSRIGELENDSYRQMLLCRLAKPAAALLYRIAARMRQIEGEEFEPLEITSLVRTWDYQLRLTDVNPNADRTREGVPPTHVLGLAFDIARTAMSKERQHRLELLLDQFALSGELAYYKEGSLNGLMHYHIIALPSAEAVLVRAYERESNATGREETAGARTRYLPDAPCVSFGSSLEPFSAICSCELPLEVSASAWLADAPVSR